MPQIPDFTQFFPPLPKLARRLRVCAPCTGIHGCGAALQGMETEADTFFVHDLEPGYESFKAAPPEHGHAGSGYFVEAREF